MSQDVTPAPNRLERRKARTRAKLVAAAQKFLIEDKVNAPILEITQAADVGMGSFYNHFDSKEQLFEAVIADASEAYAAAIILLTSHLSDPAEIFATSFRLAGRMHRLLPALSQVVLKSGVALAAADRGMAAGARENIAAAVAAGRFKISDIDLAVAVASGTHLALGQLLHDQPERDDAATTDQLTGDLLRMFGLSDDEAKALCALPLPSLDQLQSTVAQPLRE